MLAVFALLASLGAPEGALAFDGPGCGGTHSGSASCGPFAVRGLPIIVYGDSGTGSGRVFLTVPGNPEIPPVLMCSWPNANSDSSCDRGYPNQSRLFNVPEPYGTFDLLCNVQSTGSGRYFCQTGHFPTASQA